MDFEKIKQLMTEFNTSETRELEITTDDFHIRLNKNETKTPLKPASKMTPQKAQTNEKIAQTTIKAPLVGSVYLKPKPDKQAYVSVGSKVKKGDVVCIIEAMKMMTEIKSDFNGTITEVLVANEELVEFEQPLFSVVEG